jgi:hypothetical protein
MSEVFQDCSSESGVVIEAGGDAVQPAVLAHKPGVVSCPLELT